MTKAVWRGAVIAESDDVAVVDGYTYFPAEAVDSRYLQPSDHRSRCPWKGTARYCDVVVNGEVNRAAAWYYPDPGQRAAPLVGGRIGFWRGVRIEADGPTSRDGPRLTTRLADRLRPRGWRADAPGSQ